MYLKVSKKINVDNPGVVKKVMIISRRTVQRTVLRKKLPNRIFENQRNRGGE